MKKIITLISNSARVLFSSSEASSPEAKAKKCILQYSDDFKLLKKELMEIEQMENKVDAIVRLFALISPLQDKGGFTTAINELSRYSDNASVQHLLGRLRIMQDHIDNAGRSEHGWNRTKTGESVTPDKVYLGDVYGLFTKTATYWNSKKDELKKDMLTHIAADPKNPPSIWYVINDYQAGSFVSSHTEGLTTCILDVEKALAA